VADHSAGLHTDTTAQFHMFYIFALFSIFINNRSLYQSFGFHKEYPIIIGFILFSDALAPMDTVVKLLMNILSRKFEFEAGRKQHPRFPHQRPSANQRV
jgi:Zn-dependent protease with chaperone function